MTKGTIIYIGGFELPDKNAAAHRVLNNGKILKELGYNVIFLDIDKRLTYDEDILKQKKSVQGFECWSMPYPKSKKDWVHYLINIDSVITIVNKFQDVRAIIAYNFQAVALMRLKKYCSKNGIKIIADCTEWYSTKGNNLVFKIIKGFDTFLRMRIIQKQLDGIIVISNYLKNYYKNCKVVCIPPLVDFSEEKWVKQSLKQSYESKKEKIRFVYAGTPGRTKDKLNLIINVLNELVEYENFIFTIVGITKEQYIENNIQQKARLDKLGDRIIFKGELSHQESLNYVRAADFSLFIREYTRANNAGFPTKFVESISCGTPVITTRTSDIPVYLIEGSNGFFVNIYDKKQIVLVLRKVLEMDLNVIREMKQTCIRSQIFHFKNYINHLNEFINNIV